MPAWSPEIANEFIRLAANDGRAFDQMQLQELVYIAHGWCLVVTGQPLTGDRPEASPHGPEYRRLADALAGHGLDPVTQEISIERQNPFRTDSRTVTPDQSELDQTDSDWVARIYQEYGDMDGSTLAALTRRPGMPWAKIFAHGAGAYRDIPHELIRAQFAELAAKPRL